MTIIKFIIKVISIILFLLLIIDKLVIDSEGIIQVLQDYDEVIQLSTSLLLAYVTWKYADASKKTLDFMRYSFEKEYEEDVKFMFIEIDNNLFFSANNQLAKEAKLNQNPDLISGKDDFLEDWELDYDSNLLCIRLFNSGRRLISHIKLNYLIEIYDLQGLLYTTKRVETIIAKTIQPNDYISLPLVKVDQLPQLRIEILSLKSFNGLGKEQLENSPQKEKVYYNKHIC